MAAVQALTMAKFLEAVLRQMDGDLEGIGLGIDSQAAIWSPMAAGRGLQLSWRTRHF